MTDLPSELFRPSTARDHALVRVSRPDYHDWLHHISAAAGCTRPVRLAGAIDDIGAGTGDRFSTMDTASMPDGVIYKACGNRREAACPSCALIYQRDAYQLIRAGLVGGKGIPDTIATHPTLFVTFTAPSFGPVHTRVVGTHACGRRNHCDCRPRPCHPDRNRPTCPHGVLMTCSARHDHDDARLGTPLCLDCYDYNHQAVWNNQAGELWRRTTLAITRAIRRIAKRRGLDPDTVRISFGKVTEIQRRAAVHFHAVIRLDINDPQDPTRVIPPAPELLGVADLGLAVTHAAGSVTFVTDPHPAMPTGWVIAWGTQLDVRTINTGTDGAITDGMVAGYLAKYATKATEAAGHTSRRLTADTIDVYADPDGTHTERLVDACWTLGGRTGWDSLRRWAHMLGFGGHFLTKSRRYSVTFRLLRQARLLWQIGATEANDGRNLLKYVGAGWHNPGDALLAATAARTAQKRRQVAREESASLLAG
jgi:hypothetical protein